MKKILLTAASVLAAICPSFADEGMWLLPLLEKMNSKVMTDMGCKLSAEQIYDINHSSLKDAIVQFGGGCTGEIISNEGLLVTNHHCGYSTIQKLSTPEHNYLEDGFWAMNRSEELPAKGLSVTFLQKMTDITPIIEKAKEAALKEYKDSSNADDYAEAAAEAAVKMLKSTAEGENPNCRVTIMDFYNDNVTYLIVYKTYTDVRFVGAPPASVGKFGGETDNWMWPRHTGDFSMFRVYAGKDNEPADYSKDNVPYTPKQSLKISLKGVDEGDFTFIMGYPGRTQRFQTADQLELMLKKQDIRIDVRTLRQGLMKEAMEADPEVRLKYANKYASSANGWKKWIGQRKAFKTLDIIGREEQKESSFINWVDGNKHRREKYGQALEEIRTAVDSSAADVLAFTLLSETGLATAPFQLAGAFINSFRSNVRESEDSAAALQAGKEAVISSLKDYDDALERKIAKALLSYYRDHARAEDALEIEGVDFASMDIETYVDSLFDNTLFTSANKLDDPDFTYGTFKSDPATALYNAIGKRYISLYTAQSKWNDTLAKGSKAFAAGLLEWEKGKPTYPDANFTMRLTYGTVKGYSPADGVIYKYYTTLDGVMQKENPDVYEFHVPAKLKELYEAHDFGQYADADGKVRTCFITNNDITGGNSGSPVMNADGELIGLAFDGNWESMSSDVMFEPDLQRCICVDIRYVLFLVDKVGGAGYLLDEMNIVRQ